MRCPASTLIVKHGNVCDEFQKHLAGEEPLHSYITEIVNIQLPGKIHIIGIGDTDAQFSYEKYQCRTLAKKKSIQNQIQLFLQLWRVISESNPDLIIVVHPWELLIAPFIWSRLKRRRMVACLAKVPYSIHMGKLRKTITLVMIRPLLLNIEVVLARSHIIKRQLVKWGINEENVKVYMPPYNSSFYQSKDLLPISDQHFNIVFIGRLVRLKGVYDLLEIFQNVLLSEPEARLYIIGDGEELGSLKQMAEELQIHDSTYFIGSISQTEVHGYLSPADVAILPSYQEGLGKTALEALLAGLPVLATEGTGFMEFIIHGKNGYLYPPGDITRFSDTLKNIIRDRELLDSLKINAKVTGDKILNNTCTFSECIREIISCMPTESS